MHLRFAAAFALLTLSAGGALAQARHDAGPTDNAGVPDPSIATSLPPAVADPGGVRASLARRGMEYGINYIGEVLSNRKGGIERGTIYQGRLEMYVDADLEKSLGWTGLSFHAHGYQIHGEGISVTKVGNLNALSGIEATSNRSIPWPGIFPARSIGPFPRISIRTAGSSRRRNWPRSSAPS